MGFTLTSSAFLAGGEIPQKYTCEGEDISPELRWIESPAGTISFVLICDDHDVPTKLKADGVWDHWVLFNIPSHVSLIQEGVKDFPLGTKHGKNSWGLNQYGGPCPPDREHRYEFKLFALDTILDLPEGASKSEVEQAMQGHVLGIAILMGRYDKQERRKG